MNGKGSARRKQLVSEKQFTKNWQAVFGKRDDYDQRREFDVDDAAWTTTAQGAHVFYWKPDAKNP
jgi:hypothetical protein